MKKYNVYSDPGHAWMKIERKELKELGILKGVTGCSYQKGEHVFLEEDCDLSMFINTYKLKFGVSPIFREFSSNKRSRIRSYNRFCLTELERIEV